MAVGRVERVDLVEEERHLAQQRMGRVLAQQRAQHDEVEQHLDRDGRAVGLHLPEVVVMMGPPVVARDREPQREQVRVPQQGRGLEPLLERRQRRVDPGLRVEQARLIRLRQLAQRPHHVRLLHDVQPQGGEVRHLDPSQRPVQPHGRALDVRQVPQHLVELRPHLRHLPLPVAPQRILALRQRLQFLPQVAHRLGVVRAHVVGAQPRLHRESQPRQRIPDRLRLLLRMQVVRDGVVERLRDRMAGSRRVRGRVGPQAQAMPCHGGLVRAPQLDDLALGLLVPPPLRLHPCRQVPDAVRNRRQRGIDAREVGLVARQQRHLLLQFLPLEDPLPRGLLLDAKALEPGRQLLVLHQRGQHRLPMPDALLLLRNPASQGLGIGQLRKGCRGVTQRHLDDVVLVTPALDPGGHGTKPLQQRLRIQHPDAIVAHRQPQQVRVQERSKPRKLRVVQVPAQDGNERPVHVLQAGPKTRRTLPVRLQVLLRLRARRTAGVRKLPFQRMDGLLPVVDGRALQVLHEVRKPRPPVADAPDFAQQGSAGLGQLPLLAPTVVGLLAQGGHPLQGLPGLRRQRGPALLVGLDEGIALRAQVRPPIRQLSQQHDASLVRVHQLVHLLPRLLEADERVATAQDRLVGVAQQVADVQRRLVHGQPRQHQQPVAHLVLRDRRQRQQVLQRLAEVRVPVVVAQRHQPQPARLALRR